MSEGKEIIQNAERQRVGKYEKLRDTERDETDRSVSNRTCRRRGYVECGRGNI